MTGDEARAYAKELSESKMISPYFRGSEANILYAMELGRVYGLEAVTVLQNIHIFPDKKGNLKAATSAHLMVTLARRAGHIVTTTTNPQGATCTIVRGDSIFGKMLKGNVSPDELAHYSAILSTLKEMGVDAKAMGISQIRWTTEMAIRAELTDKDNWAKYPHAMLASAAKRDCVRITCEEVLIQLADRSSQIMTDVGPLSVEGSPIEVNWSYTADELGASITDEGEEVKLSPQQRPRVDISREDAPRPNPAPSSPDPDTAAADIAAQAASDPSRAGWHDKNPSQENSEEQAARSFVIAKAPGEIAFLSRKTILSEDIDDQVKDRRIIALMKTLASACDIDKVAATVTAISDLDDLGSKVKLELLGRLHQAAKDSNILSADIEGGSTSLKDHIVETVRPLMTDETND